MKLEDQTRVVQCNCSSLGYFAVFVDYLNHSGNTIKCFHSILVPFFKIPISVFSYIEKLLMQCKLACMSKQKLIKLVNVRYCLIKTKFLYVCFVHLSLSLRKMKIMVTCNPAKSFQILQVPSHHNCTSLYNAGMCCR